MAAAAHYTPRQWPLLGATQEVGAHFPAQYQRLPALPRRVRRALQRQWRQSFAGIALLLALGEVPALAATINVDGTTCTLAQAIIAANTDTATGGCRAGRGADTLVLAAESTHTLHSGRYTGYGLTGLPPITSTMTIEGNGSTIQRANDAPAFRIFAVHSAGDLTLRETTVSGGDVRPFGGGGVLNFRGTLTLTHSTISGNAASYGGGVRNVRGTLTLTHSTISGNSAN